MLRSFANRMIVKHVRDVSAESASVPQPTETSFVDEASPSAPAETPTSDNTMAIQSDPTVMNAGLTEINAAGDVHLNGVGEHSDPAKVPDPSSAVTGAANAVAEASWDNKLSQSMTSGPDGFELVEVPRDPAETETGLNATPAAATTTQSWAEDVPTEAAPAPTPANDGFHEVHHGRGRGRGGYGEFRGGRGRGRGEGFRGRGGYRGDRGGRGGRGPRGNRGGTRGSGGGTAPDQPPQ